MVMLQSGQVTKYSLSLSSITQKRASPFFGIHSPNTATLALSLIGVAQA